MKRIRLLLVAALAAASLGIAAPAYAGKCDPDGICPECDGGVVEVLYRKITGHELECA